MTRLIVFCLSICFFALGTGTAEYLHDLDHDAQDAAEDAAARRAGKTPIDHPPHDESNCPTHMALHAPVLTGTVTVPLLILLGLLIAFLTELPDRLPRPFPFLRIDCRGPPLAFSAI